ncbi:MAG: serine/threonine-protein kinase, partial [Phycisphaerae bacterium]
MDGYQHRSSDDALIAAAVRQTDGLRAASGDDSAGRPLHQRFARPSDRSLPYESLSGYEFSGARFRGGQGEVFEAIHTATRRRVAVKFLHDAQIADDGARRARFLREIEILAQLRHPNVVAIHTSDEVDGRTFYVMDFVAGAPLDRCLQREQERAAPAPRLRDETIVALFRQICDGVQAAHVRGVIHRDLKPANVLVDEFGVPRVVDFGLAKLLNDDSAHQMTAMTETGQFVGSLPWSSPEQVGGAHDALDTRSDVYSLGVMLYNALTGRHPYSLQGPMQEILRRIQSEPPTPIDHYRPDLPDDLATIVAKCLSKEPARRYQTAGELGRDLERYLADEPIEAKRDSTRYLLGKMLARHRVPLAAATAFLLVIVTASIVSLSLWRQAVVARDEAVSARKVADNRFDEVRALAHTFVFELDDQIRELPGSTTARLWATSTALDYLDRLAADARADASLRTELGQGYRRVGQILGQPGHANLGKFDDAYVSLTKGRDLLRDVAQSDPLNTGAFRDWAAVEMSLGDVQRVRQQLEDARNHYLEYHNVAQRIWETTEAPSDHREVASALLSLSDLAMAESRYDDALAQASTAADILHALPE